MQLANGPYSDDNSQCPRDKTAVHVVFRKYFASIIPEVVSLSFITNFLSKKVIYTPYGALTSVQFNSIDISCYYPCNI